MRMCPLCCGAAVLGLAVGATSLLGGAGSHATAPTTTAEGSAIDAVHSGVVFRIQHFGAGMFQGMFHSPTGTFSYDPAKPENSTLDVTVKLDNLNTNNAKRDSDIKGAPFFSAKEFPTITFKSTACKKTGDHTFDATGDLTLRGVTKSVTAQVTHTGTGKGRGGEIIGLEAKFSIKRSDFGMSGMQGPLGDEVWLTVFLEGPAK